MNREPELCKENFNYLLFGRFLPLHVQVMVRNFTLGILSLLCSLFISSNVLAEESPLDALKTRAVSFFNPLSGYVVSSEAGVVRINIGLKDGILKGMRLKVLKEGEYFYHPVTKETLGRVEKFSGIIEVTQASDDFAICKVIDGEVAIGDITRISATNIRLLFYQDEIVDYYLEEAYYSRLKGSRRFEIIDAPIEKIESTKILELAEKEGVEVILILKTEKDDGKTYLRQRLLWADGALLSEDRVEVPLTLLGDIRSGLEYIEDVEHEPLLSYDLPFDAEIVAAGDINGDGKTEIIVATESDIYVYQYDVGLELLFQLNARLSGTISMMDLYDLDRDGKDELFIALMSHDRSEVNSFIFQVIGQNTHLLWKTKGFIRVMDGKVLYQKYSLWNGYFGPIYLIEYKDNSFINKGEYSVLKGLNIYDFIPLFEKNEEKSLLIVDKNNYLVLKDSAGNTVWRSQETVGEAIREYADESSDIGLEKGSWYVRDKIVRKSNGIVMIQRSSIAKAFSGFGFKNSRLLLYSYNNSGIEQSVLINKISGKIFDYAIFGDNVALLISSFFSIRPVNFFRGKSIFTTRLQIYSLQSK